MLHQLRPFIGRITAHKAMPIFKARLGKIQHHARNKKIIVISVLLFVGAATITTSVLLGFNQKADASSANIVWTTQADFDTNTSTPSNGTAPAPTTKTNIDTAVTPGSVKIAKNGAVFFSGGSLSGLKIDAGSGNIYRYYQVSCSATLSSSTWLQLSVRTSDTSTNLSNAQWHTISGILQSSITNTTKFSIPDIIAQARWFELKMDLATTNTAVTPTINDCTASYNTDAVNPTPPTHALAYTDWNLNSELNKIATYPTDPMNIYQTNSTTPIFNLLGSTDNSGFISGYYEYFGTDNTADPTSAYGTTIQGDCVLSSPGSVYLYGDTFSLTSAISANCNTDPQTLYSNGENDGIYYLRSRAIDLAGNKSPIVTSLQYNLDTVPPTLPSNLSVSPFGWSSNNSFTMSWGASTDDQAVSGFNSGLQGYEYKLNDSSNDWTGGTSSVHSLPSSDTSVVISGADVLPGKNTLYIRSIDNVGNVSAVTQVSYYYTGAAPTAPTLSSTSPYSNGVNPQNNSVNSFSFQWGLPDANVSPYQGNIIGYRYAINVPDISLSSSNTTLIMLNNLPPGVSVDPISHILTFTGVLPATGIPAATQQGSNTMSVVAVGDNGQSGELVAYGASNIAHIGFNCSTTAPSQPLNVQLFDTSDRNTHEYSVAIKWANPTSMGVGFAGYNIERSSDGTNFSFLGTTSGNSFIDASGLTNSRYYYRIFAKDNSGNISLPSDIKSIIPTGKYTVPPDITVGPEVTARVSTAPIRWVTNRGSSSFVEVGQSVIDVPCSSTYGLIQGRIDFVEDHRVTLTGLTPDSLYYYRVKFVDEDGNIGCSDSLTFHTLPAPRVERVTVKDIRLHTAVLTWYTSEPASVDLLYGKNTSYPSVLTDVSGGATTVHSVLLDGLDDSTTYHFAIRITDIDGGQIISDDYSFDTLPYPKISLLKFSPVKDKATSTFKVNWTTNVPTTSVVEYQTDTGKVQESAKSKLETNHEIIISGLMDNTYYLMTAMGVDQYGNQAISDKQRVKTDYDTRPPVLTDIAIETSGSDFGVSAKSQVVVSWQTDELSTSQVEYGVGVTGDNYNIRSQEDTALTSSHVVVLTDLRPSSTYHIRAVSSDASGNRGVSEPQSAITEQARSSVLDIIVNSLQSSLGWLFGMGG